MLELQGFPLLELPQELLAELLSYLDYQSLLRCCMVRRSLSDPDVLRLCWIMMEHLLDLQYLAGPMLAFL